MTIRSWSTWPGIGAETKDPLPGWVEIFPIVRIPKNLSRRTISCHTYSDTFC